LQPIFAEDTWNSTRHNSLRFKQDPQVKSKRPLIRVTMILCIALSFAAMPAGAQDADQDLIQLVVNLLGESDKDLRALGLEQVRTEAKGPAATRRFAALLPKLPADAQVGLLRALADRGDKAARPAVLDMLTDKGDESVRIAAIAALGALGEQADLKLLVELLAGSPNAERNAARTSLIRLQGDTISPAIASQMKQAPSAVRVELIEILAARRAVDTIGDLLSAAVDSDPKVRAAAMTALGEIADPEHLSGMVAGVLKAEPGAERDAAEKAVMFVCGRIPEVSKRDESLLDAIARRDETERTALLSTLGRVGGAKSLAIIQAAIADPRRHNSGIRALCNWPNASVSARLIELAEHDEHAEHRMLVLATLIRIAPLPDGRPDREKLALVRKVMEMCQNDEQRTLLLRRASAIRTVETLRYILPYLDQPQFAEQACESIVELAHHRGLREPNKAEFHQALDKVIAISKDAVVIDRANRYKRDQTWVRPKAPGRD
jgi:hypothetical protein